MYLRRYQVLRPKFPLVGNFAFGANRHARHGINIGKQGAGARAEGYYWLERAAHSAYYFTYWRADPEQGCCSDPNSGVPCYVWRNGNITRVVPGLRTESFGP